MLPPVSASPSPSHGCICQIDASWHLEDSLSGHGWVLVGHENILHLGLKTARSSLSPLHAEFDSLLQAMDCMISLGKTSCYFASDCADLISILEQPTEWPTFVAEMATFRSLISFFPTFNAKFFPRCNNVRADFLAKQARVRSSLFSRVNMSVPDWLSPAKSFLSDYLI